MWLRSMFAGVVETYDFLNRVLTWGLDEVWRKKCARECASDGVVLDLCCGTGDLALRISEYANPEAYVLGVDFNRAMLEKAMNKKGGAERKVRRWINNRENEVRVHKCSVDFILADAAHLPFKEGSMDQIVTSFSLRNLVYRNPLAEIFLEEALRTLRPGGRFVAVETSQPESRPVNLLYHLYLRRVVPFVGGLVSGRKAAYQYLGTSATNFPSREEVAEMLLGAGFRKVSSEHMTLGTVGMYVGVR